MSDKTGGKTVCFEKYLSHGNITKKNRFFFLPFLQWKKPIINYKNFV
jgi:hypothetical protein